jgi:hypothetical protein
VCSNNRVPASARPRVQTQYPQTNKKETVLICMQFKTMTAFLWGKISKKQLKINLLTTESILPALKNADWALVAHVYNSSYSGWFQFKASPRQIVLKTLSRKYSTHTQKKVGEVAQVVERLLSKPHMRPRVQTPVQPKREKKKKKAKDIFNFSCSW